MEPIYDQHGDVVGWLRQDVIFDLGGQPRAFIHTGGSSLSMPTYTFGGRHLGTLTNGWFQDPTGQAVGFIKSASGPVPPVAQPTPAMPAFAVVPLRPLTPVAPVPPVAATTWGAQGWAGFLP